MAIWQYTFELIPKEKLGVNDNVINSEIYNKLDFWNDRKCDLAYFTPITQLLPLEKSWHRDLLVFGSEDSTCFKLLREHDKVSEVTIRIDFRHDYLFFINEIIDFCLLKSLVLIDEEYKIPALNKINIDSLIKASNQYRKFEEMSQNREK